MDIQSKRRPVGRPAMPYDPEIADALCELIAVTGHGVKQNLEHMQTMPQWANRVPSVATVYRWLNFSAEFREMSARARTLQADTLADEAIEEAQTSRVGEIRIEKKGPDGNVTEVKTADNVERSKLIVQTIFKRAGQLNATKYGEKIQHEHTGGATLTLALPESMAKRLQERIEHRRDSLIIEGEQ